MTAGTAIRDLFTPPPGEMVRVPAITVCEPYSSLICLPDGHRSAKRIENRTWPTGFRGRLLIHAGKSREWMEDRTDRQVCGKWGLPGPLVFGAAIGVADVVACIHEDDPAPPGYEWVRDDLHASGPYYLVLANVQRLPEPLPMRGGQKIFAAELPRALAVDLGFGQD